EGWRLFVTAQTKTHLENGSPKEFLFSGLPFRHRKASLLIVNRRQASFRQRRRLFRNEYHPTLPPFPFHRHLDSGRSPQGVKNARSILPAHPGNRIEPAKYIRPMRKITGGFAQLEVFGNLQFGILRLPRWNRGCSVACAGFTWGWARCTTARTGRSWWWRAL